MRPIDELCAEIDRTLAQVSMRCTSSGFIARKYEGTFEGMPLRASLSIFMDTGGPTRATSGQATGYQLALECDNGLATRWVMGKSVPVMLGAGLTRVANVTPQALLRADDTAWAARFLEGEVRPAMNTLAEGTSFVEQRPGTLQLQLMHVMDTDLPPLMPLIVGFGVVLRTSLRAPAPRPAKARLSDNRALMVLLVALVVMAGVVACGVTGLVLLGD